jgi:hypothetical protein
MSTANVFKLVHNVPTPLAVTQVRCHTCRLSNGQNAGSIFCQKICWGVMLHHRYLFQTTLIYQDITRVLRKRFTTEHQ